MTSLSTYLYRRSIMFSPLSDQHARVLVRERVLKAEAENRARSLVTVRRWQRIIVK